MDAVEENMEMVEGMGEGQMEADLGRSSSLIKVEQSPPCCS